MIAWKPSSDSCISSEGEGCTGLCPATAMKSPIALMSGFNALAALPPAPPSEIACAWLRGAAVVGAAGTACAAVSVVAADGVVGDAAWLFNKRTCPSRAMSLSSRSRIFCWSAALSDCPDAACEVPVCCGYAGMAAINEITACNPIRKLVDIRVMDVNISSSVGLRNRLDASVCATAMARSKVEGGYRENALVTLQGTNPELSQIVREKTGHSCPRK